MPNQVAVLARRPEPHPVVAGHADLGTRPSPHRRALLELEHQVEAADIGGALNLRVLMHTADELLQAGLQRDGCPRSPSWDGTVPHPRKRAR